MKIEIQLQFQHLILKNYDSLGNLGCFKAASVALQEASDAFETASDACDVASSDAFEAASYAFDVASEDLEAAVPFI